VTTGAAPELKHDELEPGEDKGDQVARAKVDDGYFPEGSMLREVQSARVVGLHYGQRALTIGALNPLTYMGTAVHARNPNKPFERLTRTATMFEVVWFKSKAEADKVLAAVARIHQPVKGETPQAAGKYPAGTHYSAMDPELMLWTVGVIADSSLYFYELLVRKLSDDEKQRLWDDYLRFAELFGMKSETAPQTYVAFRQWFDETLNSSKMHLTEGAREMGLAIAFESPLPWYAYGYKRIRNALIRGSLPDRVREMYGIDWSLGHKAEFALAVAASRTSQKVAPRSLTRGTNSTMYATAKEGEKRRLAAGKPSPRMSI